MEVPCMLPIFLNTSKQKGQGSDLRYLHQCCSLRNVLDGVYANTPISRFFQMKHCMPIFRFCYRRVQQVCFQVSLRPVQGQSPAQDHCLMNKRREVSQSLETQHTCKHHIF